MLFVELRFFIFFAVVFGITWSLRNNDARKIFLLLCSYFFYACWSWKFMLILIASTTMDYTLGILLTRWEAEEKKRRMVVAVSVIVNLSLIAFFKYCNFFIDSAGTALAWFGMHPQMTTLKIVIPVGVSFYTFQSLSYTLEVYRGHLKAEKKFLDLAFFVSFFPQLVAGPIVRAMYFLPQTKSLRVFANVDVRGALVLFLVGFVKKACVADLVAEHVDKIFASPGAYTVASTWLGVLLYAVQIFCDFSGYTDMALACARLLGYDLALNFNFPYFADSITDFWRRWHISLSSWLRDYLYISLGGNRGSKLFIYRNLMLTMLLGGLWHGSSWTFFVWGGLHGAALIVHREWKKLTDNGGALLKQIIAVIAVPLCFYWVCITWVPFRAGDLFADKKTNATVLRSGAGFARADDQKAMYPEARYVRDGKTGDYHAFDKSGKEVGTLVLKSSGFGVTRTILRSFVLFQSNGKLTLDSWLAWFFAAAALVHWLNFKRVFSSFWRRVPDFVFAAGYGCAWALTLMWVPEKYAPFIYFQF